MSDNAYTGKNRLRFICNGLTRDSITLLRFCTKEPRRMNPMHEITELLKAWSNGDTQALDRLMPLVDQELKKIAHSYMRNERSGHILQTTALVHEALIKLIRENISWGNRKQFYALVAKRMRQVLVDYARRAQRAEYVEFDEAVISKEKP